MGSPNWRKALVPPGCAGRLLRHTGFGGRYCRSLPRWPVLVVGRAVRPVARLHVLGDSHMYDGLVPAMRRCCARGWLAWLLCWLLAGALLLRRARGSPRGGGCEDLPPLRHCARHGRSVASAVHVHARRGVLRKASSFERQRPGEPRGRRGCQQPGRPARRRQHRCDRRGYLAARRGACKLSAGTWHATVPGRGAHDDEAILSQTGVLGTLVPDLPHVDARIWDQVHYFAHAGECLQCQPAGTGHSKFPVFGLLRRRTPGHRACRRTLRFGAPPREKLHCGAGFRVRDHRGPLDLRAPGWA
mmetsp:Transcript_66888/g.204848  ORF Transcript_66888/g.204848 Transcript_66888/m.204848 type:complete len:301 (+) Transcript_66888:325-1227(+)